MKIFPKTYEMMLLQVKAMRQPAEEIRLRIGQPIQIVTGDNDFFWNEHEQKLQQSSYGAKKVTRDDILHLMDHVCDYSLYAYEESIREGYVTVLGGHRIGMSGGVISEQMQIRTMVHIYYINVRIAREWIGCADGILPYLYQKENICNTLIISPPGYGKTTLLRDCIRQISKGDEHRKGKKVSLIDERGEIAASYQGIPQKQVGIRTDVLNNCPKSLGISLLLRSMSPQVIAVDELGRAEDYEALKEAARCGVKIIGTIHGASLQDVRERMLIGFFERFVLLTKSRQGVRKCEIYNEKLERIVL